MNLPGRSSRANPATLGVRGRGYTFALSPQRSGSGRRLTWQHVHGGLRLGSPSGDPFKPPGEVDTPARLFEHDRLLRDNNFRAGMSVAYSMDRMDVFFSYIELLRGSDSHAGRAFTAAVSWPFEIGRRPTP